LSEENPEVYNQYLKEKGKEIKKSEDDISIQESRNIDDANAEE
jgi:hypothetical protein